jgi:ribosomal-protein-alanine N-acetyltransferase
VENSPAVKAPTIETPRLTLRAFAEEDFEPYFERILGDRDVMHFLSGSGEPRTRVEAQASFARILGFEVDAIDYYWVVVERISKEVIGHAILQPLDKGELIEVGYALGKRWWGHGLATEASKAVVDFGFADTPLELIVGVARRENAASRRVLEKTGLSFAGMRRYYNLDLAYYELTKAAYAGRRGS